MLHFRHEHRMPLSTFLNAGQDESNGGGFDAVCEADHRIANSLSLIASCVRLQATNVAKQTSPFTNEDVTWLLAETAAWIDAVGQLHKLLSREPLGQIDIGAHLDHMCATFESFISLAGTVKLARDLQPGCVVRPKQVVPIALIVSEMVTNAMKYAHPAGAAGRIDIACRYQEDGIVIEVSDDGVGLPQDFDVERDGGLGFQVVRTLANQLGAKTVFDSQPPGLRLALILPRKQ